MHDFDQEPLWLFLRFIWLNGPGWMVIFERKREQKNDQKRLLTDTTPKQEPLTRTLASKLVKFVRRSDAAKASARWVCALSLFAFARL